MSFISVTPRSAAWLRRSGCMIFVLSLAILLPSCGDKPVTGTTAEGAADTAKARLRKDILNLLHSKQATVGLAVASLTDSDDTLSINGDADFALMSVAKFPQSLLLLHLSDSGKYDRSAPVRFDPVDLDHFTGSTIRKDHPQTSFSLSLPEVLRYMIGQSDNISANKVFALEGGPEAVTAYVHHLGIRDISIATDYAHMRPDSLKKNRSTPKAMVELLRRFHRRELLSDSSQQLLWTAMVEATSGTDRLKAGLPEGTLIGHKTGTSSSDPATGITPAYNDVGIIRLPDGRYYAIAVFVSDSREEAKENAAIMAGLSKLIWDYYNTKH